MRRWTTLGVWVLVACGGGAEPEGVVARVDDWTLAQDRLAELLVLAQPFPLEPAPAEELVRHWVGVSALARRLAAGDDLTGERAVRASTWLERREALLAEDRRERLGSAVAEPSRADFERGAYRLVAHVLRRVGPETSAEERGLQRRTAERILARLVEGGTWDSAVARSEDPATAEASGLLGLVTRGELPDPLDRAAFQLEPGQVSSVVESPRGFHILYRPRYEDVAELFARRLRERRLAEADAAAGEELAARTNPRPAASALRRLREIAEEPLDGLDSDDEMVSWADGALSAGTVARYVVALPPASRREMTGAADSALVSFLEELAVREMRAVDAAARLPETVEALEGRLRRQHVEEVGDWLERLGLARGDSPTRATVDRYMERVASRQVSLRSLPPLFRAWLLGRVESVVVRSRIPEAVERARAMLGAPAGGETTGPGR